MFSSEIQSQARALIDELRALSAFVVSAESCTGGLIAGAITEIAGSSDVIGRGFVTYSNDAKHDVLGVPTDMLETHGAVSEPVARAMVAGALAAAPEARFGVAVTGIAGPGGGSAEKPVGLVHLAASERGDKTLHLQRFYGTELSRADIRAATVLDGLKLVRKLAGET